MPRQRTLSILLLAWLVPAAGLAAKPSPQERAAALLEEGVQKRADGNDEAALQLFRQADALDSTSKSRAQLALAEQSLGMWVLAERHLRDALALVGDAWIDKNRTLLESSLTRIAAELGWIDVLGAPAGAAIVVDGESAGQSPLEAPVRTPAGTRLLEVRAAGYEPYARRILVRGGEITRERAVAMKVHAASSAETARSGPRYVEVPVASPMRTVGWVALGSGVAAALFGGAGFVVRQNLVDRYNDDERCPGTASVDQPARCGTLQSGVSRWTALGAVSLAAGGALTVSGLALVLAAPPAHQKVQVADSAPACVVSGLGLTCAGRF